MKPPKKKKCKFCSKLFDPKTSLQMFDKPKCMFAYEKAKKKKKHTKLYKLSGKEEERLRHKADTLYQEVGIAKNPYSLVSGEPTEVIHHWIYKSHSNNLRYYPPNGIPLTNDEHGTIHGNRPESIKNQIFIKKGVDWAKDLDDKSKTICKLTVPYLNKVIENLTSILNKNII